MKVDDLIRDSVDVVVRQVPPKPGLADQALQRARQRRRRQVGTVAASVVVVALLGGIAVSGLPDTTTSPAPATNPEVPTLPDTLYGVVPSDQPDLTEAPLGGPASVLYRGHRRGALFESGEDAFFVVGAESDDIRAIPGARSAFGSNAIALSPSGRHVAYGNDPGITDPEPLKVTVVDVTTGEATSHQIEDAGFGGMIDHITWYPDGERVAVQAAVHVQAADGELDISGKVMGLILDITDGTWQPRRFSAPEAIAQNGQLEIRESAVASEPEVAEVDGDAVTSLDLGETEQTSAARFSPDSRRVAVITADSSERDENSLPLMMLHRFDTTTGREVATVRLGDDYYAQLIGWGQHGLILRMSHQAGSWIERVTINGDDVERSRIVESDGASSASRLSIASDFIDAPTRVAERPRPDGITRFTDSQWAWPAIVATILVALTASIQWFRRRRRELNY